MWSIRLTEELGNRSKYAVTQENNPAEDQRGRGVRVYQYKMKTRAGLPSQIGKAETDALPILKGRKGTPSPTAHRSVAPKLLIDEIT